METLCSIGHAWGAPRGRVAGSHSSAREESACCPFSFPSPWRQGRDGHETGVRGAGRGFQNVSAFQLNQLNPHRSGIASDEVIF